MLRLRSLQILLVGLAFSALLPAQKPLPDDTPYAVEEKIPGDPKIQPIPFSHKIHAGQGVKCLDCHPIRTPGFAAGFPKESACIGCHATIKRESPQIQKLAEAAKSKTPVQWVRIYSLPAFVWFSHEHHVQDAKVECESCHGPVSTRDVLAKEKAINMASCMACHGKMRAANGCTTCHGAR